MPSEPATFMNGRRGVVLGVSGANGAGWQIARYFRELGAEVAVSHRAPRRAAVREVAAGTGCRTLECDFADEASVRAAFDEAGTAFGRLDFLVHTLVHVPEGILSRPVTELSAEDFATVMDLGVRSLLVAARYAQPWLTRGESPRIVTLLSGGGALAMPNYHAVGIAKAALGAAVRYLAAELGPAQILCNAVSFSILETDAAQRVVGRERTSETKSYLAKRSMTRVPLEFSDVVKSVAFLASPLCSNVTGETLTVDAGFSRSYF
jgi:enoyl-[acyl-carrier protein] reductase I